MRLHVLNCIHVHVYACIIIVIHSSYRAADRTKTRNGLGNGSKTDHDELQIQGLERNLYQLCHVASKIIFCCEWFESSSERYFID